MSIKRTRDGTVIVNDELWIEHSVVFMGYGPQIWLLQKEEDEDCESVVISTKQEAEEVMKACQMFLDSIDTWDYVFKDKPDDDNE